MTVTTDVDADVQSVSDEAEALSVEPVWKRFNDFHLAVSVYSERVGWILSKLDIDQEGVDMLLMLQEQLEALLSAQDCRPDPVQGEFL